MTISSKFVIRHIMDLPATFRRDDLIELSQSGTTGRKKQKKKHTRAKTSPA